MGLQRGHHPWVMERGLSVFRGRQDPQLQRGHHPWVMESKAGPLPGEVLIGRFNGAITRG